MPSSRINSNWTRPILAICLLALVFVSWLSLRDPQPARQTTPSEPKSAPAQSAAKTDVLPTEHGNHHLQDVCDDLHKGADGRSIRQKLAGLRKALSAMPSREAVAAVRQFLDSKADASTHLGFKPASNGTLDEAPTLRTFLLDELARLDPAAAADYAKVVLASMDSADEWAVAMRNLATGDASTDGRALLEQKMAQMLQYGPWQQNPSIGFLEAFDVPVYLGGTDFVPTLSSLLQSQDNPAVAHAAYLALDRLVINDTTAVLQSLAAAPDSMAGRESTRADYFARANVSDPQQQQVLVSYLLNPSINTAELQTFAGVFPNANFMISPNLLTQPATPNHDALMSLDAESLAVAQQWLADPHFARVAPELQTIIQRLQGFAAQTRQGR